MSLSNFYNICYMFIIKAVINLFTVTSWLHNIISLKDGKLMWNCRFVIPRAFAKVHTQTSLLSRASTIFALVGSPSTLNRVDILSIWEELSIEELISLISSSSVILQLQLTTPIFTPQIKLIYVYYIFFIIKKQLKE